MATVQGLVPACLVSRQLVSITELVSADRVLLQVGQGAELLGSGLGRMQYDLGGAAGQERFLPTGCAQAPAVAGLQAGEAVLRPWGR